MTLPRHVLAGELRQLFDRKSHLIANHATWSSAFNGVYSTGPMGSATKEQALILDTPTGLVVITGYAHPGIVEIVPPAKRQRGKEVCLLIGGFHQELFTDSLKAAYNHAPSQQRDSEKLGLVFLSPHHFRYFMEIG